MGGLNVCTKVKRNTSKFNELLEGGEVQTNLERSLTNEFHLEFLQQNILERKKLMHEEHGSKSNCESQIKDALSEHTHNNSKLMRDSTFHTEKVFLTVEQRLKDYIAVYEDHVENHYKLKKSLLKTPECEIFEAITIKDSKKRAIKIYEMKSSAQSQVYLERVLSFAPILDHPNIIRLYEIFVLNNQLFLAYEFCEGTLLKFVINQRALKLEKNILSSDYQEYVKKVAFQILKALCYLHEKQTAHLSINLKTILMTRMSPKKTNEVFAKLIGFGKSCTNVSSDKLIPNAIKRVCSDKNMLIAPELTLQNCFGLKTDIWDLGFALFEAITLVDLKKQQDRYQRSRMGLEKLLKEIWEDYFDRCNYQDENFFDLILKMIEPQYGKRWTASECLSHPWFSSEQMNMDDSTGTNAMQQILNEKKTNNLMSYIENLLIYKNIEEEELSYITKIFYEIDKDHSGSVQLSELLNHLKTSKTFRVREDLLESCMNIIKKSDLDSSGSIDFHQFIQAICNKQQHVKEETLSDIFNQFDFDGNGKITIQELKKNLQNCQFVEIEYYMKTIDQDFNGEITKSEFIKYCINKFTEKWGPERKQLQDPSFFLNGLKKI